MGVTPTFAAPHKCLEERFKRLHGHSDLTEHMFLVFHTDSTSLPWFQNSGLVLMKERPSRSF
jgi:hypothetical protein